MRLRHNSTIAARKKVKPSEFARVYHSQARKKFVQQLPCTLHSGACSGPIHGHHTKTGGTGRKADYDTIVPVCTLHHRVIHQFGQREAFEAHRVDPKQAAARVEAMWRASQ